MLPYFKPYYKATATKTTEYWQNNTHIQEHNKEPRNRSNTVNGSLTKAIQWKRGSLCQQLMLEQSNVRM